MDRFNIATEELPWLSTSTCSGETILDDISDDAIASELATLFGGEIEVDEIYSDDLEFLDDDY